MSRVLVVSRDHVGTSMAGPGIRALRFAQALAHHHDVTLSLPTETDLVPDRFSIVVADPFDAGRIGPLAAASDVVVAQWLPVDLMRRLARSPTRTIYDLYDPWTIEELASDARSGRKRPLTHRLARLVQSEALAAGDAFVCASERQRDFWLGWLAASGRLGPEQYAHDPSLRSLIDVVPFGIEPEPPWAGEPVLRGVLDGVGPDDRVVLWGGGIWDWLDAETVIRAIAQLSERRPDLRLVFLGLSRPNPHVARDDAGQRAVALARELGVEGTSVVFNRGWVPYERRASFLLEADVGVVAHRDDLETRLAFRTRLLDYLWAGLPIVSTRGDVLSDEVERLGLGRVVGAGDVEGWVDALADVLSEDEETRRARAATYDRLREDLSWPRATEPLVRLAGATAPPPRRRRLDAAYAEYAMTRLENALATHGPGGATLHLLRRLARRTRTDRR